MKMNDSSVFGFRRASVVSPLSLLSPNRFDVIAKYLYAKWQLSGIDSDWHRRIYLDHIGVFNGFFEADGSRKHGEQGFADAFDGVIASIADHGFDAGLSRIPVAANGELTNGAHRLAASLAVGCNVFIEDAAEQTAYIYDYRWFQRRGLALVWADAIAFETCRLLANSFVIVVYPSASGHDEELESLISSRTRIWYRKRVQFASNGALNFVQQIYRHECWVGSPHNDYKGARNKMSWCFRQPGPVRAFLVESPLETIRALKADIRALYRIGNNSVHINDTHAEAIELAGMLFNENTVDFLEARRRPALPWFDSLLPAYAQELIRAGVDRDDFCVDSSGVLAAYGMRDVRDLDFLHDSRRDMTAFAVPQISAHNCEARWYACTPDDIVHDPRCHFYFNGLKFASLAVIRSMKKRRAEAKDLADVALIDGWRGSAPGGVRDSVVTRTRKALSWSTIYQRARFAKLRLRLLWHSLRKPADR